MTSTADPTLIFSLLNVRKKTAAVIAGIAVAALCLWGLAMWQDISWRELLDILLASVLMLGGIMLAALLLIALFKLLGAVLRRLGSSTDGDNS